MLIERKLAEICPDAGYATDLAADTYENARLRWSWSILGREPSSTTFSISDYYAGDVADLDQARSGATTEPVLAEVVGSITEKHDGKPDSVKKFKLCAQSDQGVALIDVSKTGTPRLRTGDTILVSKYGVVDGEFVANRLTEFQVLKPVEGEALVADAQDTLLMRQACEL